MTLHERLTALVKNALRGTLIPVESLAELLDEPDSATQAQTGLTPGEAAVWLHEKMGGRLVSAAGVRKWMRDGRNGVVLESFVYGTRERRTTVAHLEAFAAAFREAKPAPVEPAESAPHLAPADEIGAALQRLQSTAPRKRKRAA